jgi:WD40 repeat protein
MAHSRVLLASLIFTLGPVESMAHVADPVCPLILDRFDSEAPLEEIAAIYERLMLSFGLKNLTPDQLQEMAASRDVFRLPQIRGIETRHLSLGLGKLSEFASHQLSLERRTALVDLLIQALEKLNEVKKEVTSHERRNTRRTERLSPYLLRWDGVLAAFPSPSGRRLIAQRNLDQIELVDLAVRSSGSSISPASLSKTLVLPTGSQKLIHGIFSADERRVALAFEDRLEIRNLATGAREAMHPLPKQARIHDVTSMHFSPDHQWLAFMLNVRGGNVGSDALLYKWRISDLESVPLEGPIVHHFGGTEIAGFGLSSEQILGQGPLGIEIRSGTGNPQAIVLHDERGDPITHTGILLANRQLRHLAIQINSRTEFLEIFDMDWTQDPPRGLNPRVTGFKTSARNLVWELSPDRRYLLGFRTDRISRQLQLWDFATGNFAWRDDDNKDLLRTSAIAYYPDGRRVVSGDFIGQVMVWSVDSGNQILKARPHPQGYGIERVMVSSDQRVLITVASKLGDPNQISVTITDLWEGYWDSK